MRRSSQRSDKTRARATRQRPEASQRTTSLTSTPLEASKECRRRAQSLSLHRASQRPLPAPATFDKYAPQTPVNKAQGLASVSGTASGCVSEG